ncbi:uncharacterized protein NECHADRAFT_75712 [Fusarium vanettenii 77-13-4]|uniref:Uncharacterized protein n=1 Tax=Fusarium vanettenii (strain ATCC MYA-4622 / CBS 123669 / FGSC 9596 / NRRL 45880 / 77-13-4) TaxID=660122 RepID=C7YJK7_FUSV7|nr:uncharacterized protein NECHADRAFT_81029 [Fusarium vanettenii 77-13-4]XP_003054004.1 uncharacterized protein NECHADRAFT_75712 [Fusarium vanettenii 77-13-4]EEU36817.1 predicted protein [Fusarium vanettenii 77-13-4]EEU48291.1 predicted protein [Fusarium vanettenii 77-13-4]
MFNRRQSQRQNPPDIPIFVDSTVTPATRAPSNQWVLAPIPNNQQIQAPQRFGPDDLPPFAVQQWYAQHTLPTDERSATVYFDMNPGARDRAHLTGYPPRGEPVAVHTMPWGWLVTGNWHVAWLDHALNTQYHRPHPDITPRWTRGTLEGLDLELRGPPRYTVNGTLWPTPATGMTRYVPTIREAERTGLYIRSIDQSGYVTWAWQGTQ